MVYIHPDDPAQAQENRLKTYRGAELTKDAAEHLRDITTRMADAVEALAGAEAIEDGPLCDLRSLLRRMGRDLETVMRQVEGSRDIRREAAELAAKEHMAFCDAVRQAEEEAA